MLKVERLEDRRVCDVSPLPYAMPLMVGPGTPTQPPAYYAGPPAVVVPFVQVTLPPIQVVVVGSQPPQLGVPQLKLDLPYPMPPAE